jgi:hypothetical protein
MPASPSDLRQTDLRQTACSAAEAAEALVGHNATGGSATRIDWMLVMARPADLDVGEITDKGYLSQRQVLGNRAALVELRYGEPPSGVVRGKDSVMPQK